MDDLQHVQRILGCQNYYMVLQVSSNASTREIEKSYKRIALRVHPDKNHADGAHEAFLKVQEARAILTNPIKRDLYNLSRREASIDEPDPEPNIPDNDDVPKNRHRNKRKKRRQRADEAGFKWKSCGILLLSILIMGLAWLYTSEPSHHSNPPENDVAPKEDQPQRIFSLTENTKYAIRKRTTAGKIPYYVTRDFSAELDDHYGGLLIKLEKDVKKEFKIKLIDACDLEKRHKEYWQKNSENPSDKIANSIGTPSCDKLEQLFPNDI